MGIDWEAFDAVDAFVGETLVGHDEVLQAAWDAAEAAGLPQIQVSPPQGKLLQMLARLVGAKSVLEFGTLGGYSTILLARALPEDGRLITLEANAEYAEVARGSIERAGLGDIVDLRVGPALETLPALEDEGAGPFDLTFIDADKVNTPNYFAWALDHSRPGSLIVADNVVRNGTLAEAHSPDPATKAQRPARDTRQPATGDGDDDPDRRLQGLRRLHDRPGQFLAGGEFWTPRPLAGRASEPPCEEQDASSRTWPRRGSPGNRAGDQSEKTPMGILSMRWSFAAFRSAPSLHWTMGNRDNHLRSEDMMKADYESDCDTIQITLEEGRLAGGSDVVGNGAVIVSYRDNRPAMIDVIGTRNGFEEPLRLAAERNDLDAEALLAAARAALAAPDRQVELNVGVRAVA